jgi:RES domain-containing protein
MTRAWRITKAKYAQAPLDGEGARLFGGRWSHPGTRVVYFAQSLSLATLEVLVHLHETPVLADYVVFAVDFPDECLTILQESDLPGNWRLFPTPRENQAIGDRWAQALSSLVLRVPSAIVAQEWNYLINPAHPDFQRVTAAGPFPLDIDPRVWKH